MSGALRVGWYRFRATFRQRSGGLASLVVLIALVGGVAMASLAGARRTQSSFSAFWASTNPSDLLGAISVLNPATGQQPYVPQRLAAIAHLPHVRHVESSAGLNVVFLSPTGAPLQVPFPPSPGNGSASVDGAGFDQDRLVVTSGRLADPRRADEFDVSALVAQQLGLRVGGSVPIGIYTNAQVALPGFGTTAVPPHVRTSVTLVGIVELNQAVVADQADAASNALLAWFTPALTRPLLGCCVNYTGSDVQVDRPANVAAVQAEISALLPAGFPPLQPTSVVRAKAERAIKPQAIALAVFGGLAGLAALLIAGQVIGRQVRAGDADRAVMQAVGAGPATVAADGLLGIGCAVVAGSLLAVAVAVALSPLSPIGPVRRFEPGSPVAFDWTVLAAGAGVLVVALTGVALAMAYRAAPQRATARRSDERGSALARSAARAGLPVPVVAGVRFALEPGAPRARAPVRSAIVGAALAVVVVVATLTFGLSLHTLVSRPPLYGWNWDYALVAGGASGDIPQQQVTQLLDHDGDVAAWSAAYLATIRIDGEPVPVLGEEPGAAVGPAVLSGHGVAAADQVVLGPLTLSSLHKRVGDTVTVDAGRGASRLQVVGTAAFPAVGTSGLHMEMASGGAVPTDVLTVADRNPFNDPVPGPNLALVRLRSGVNQGAALARLNAIGTATSNTANFGVAVTPVQRPAEIVNYRSMGSTPAVLDAGLAAGAAVALGLTLLASVRRRRHDLALLKALGFTRRQLAAAVAWQSTIAVAIGVVVGVPLGIASGRWLWDAFARDIHVVPSPDVPAVTVALAAVGAIVLANVVAALPGRRAARTPVALVLRSE